jgi:hypothetical protein
LVTEDQVHCEVSEGSPANTSVTGANCTGGFKWSDPDLPFGDSVTFSISRNDVDETFGIKPSTGELFVKRAGSINYDVRSKYALAITMTDVAGLTATLDLVLLVNNVNDAPVSEYPRVYVNENTAPGTVVVSASRVITTDPDSARFKYSLLLDGNSSNHNGTLFFNVTANNGAIVVGPAGLNYERHSSFILTVYKVHLVITSSPLSTLASCNLSPPTLPLLLLCPPGTLGRPRGSFSARPQNLAEPHPPCNAIRHITACRALVFGLALCFGESIHLT